MQVTSQRSNQIMDKQVSGRLDKKGEEEMKDSGVIVAESRVSARAACIAMVCLDPAQAVTATISYQGDTRPAARDAVTTLGAEMFGANELGQQGA